MDKETILECIKICDAKYLASYDKAIKSLDLISKTQHVGSALELNALKTEFFELYKKELVKDREKTDKSGK